MKIYDLHFSNLNGKFISLIIFSILLFSSNFYSQPEQLQTYKVPTVYLPELKRPSIELNKQGLERIAAGYLPEYDGQPFQLNLREKKNAKNFEDAKNQIANVFKSIGLNIDLNMLQPAGKEIINNGVQDEKGLEEYQSKYDKKFQDKLNRKLGKLSSTTIDETRNTYNEMKKLAQSKSIVYPFKRSL